MKINQRPGLERTTTHEGGTAVIPPTQMELLLTAASTYLGEDTFYEKGKARTKRLVDLVHAVTAVDPALAGDTAVQLRSTYRIRTAAILVAVEYGRAFAQLRQHPSKLTGYPRQVIDAVIQRPDECAEVIAYWQTNYGRSLPWWLRRGVADAATRVYTERNVLKYDSRNALVTPADVIELVHPNPASGWQSDLFRYLLDERHHGDGAERIPVHGLNDSNLPTIARSIEMGKVPPANRRLALAAHGAQHLADAGYTWERLSGWLPGGMDAEAWEAVIPSMGVMALLRNLRNFDKAGISEAAVDRVITKITDVDEVKRSRIVPYRVWSAYREAPSDNWKRALGFTLDACIGNMPDFSRSLILIDFSGSMQAALSAKGTVGRWEVASLMGLCARQRSQDVSLGVFGQHWAGIETAAGSKILGQMNDMSSAFQQGIVGHSTMGHTAIAQMFDPKRHDKVLMFTDDQMRDNAELSKHVPTIVTFNLGGYQPASDWGRGRIHVGGFSEAVYNMVAEALTPRPA